jgi:hypothetical protein
VVLKSQGPVGCSRSEVVSDRCRFIWKLGPKFTSCPLVEPLWNYISAVEVNVVGQVKEVINRDPLRFKITDIHHLKSIDSSFVCCVHLFPSPFELPRVDPFVCL